MVKWAAALSLLREKFTIDERHEALQLSKLQKHAPVGIQAKGIYAWRDVLEWSLPLLLSTLGVRTVDFTLYLAFSRAIGKVLDTPVFAEDTQDRMIGDIGINWHARGLVPEITTEIVTYAYRLRGIDKPLLARA